MNSKNKICLVATTIGKGDFLDFYFEKIKKEELLNNVSVIVIPDLKTPPDLFKKCKSLKEKGLNIFCPSVKEQEDFLKKLGEIYKIIPYNSDGRRNIGFLKAVEMGCDILISIDDDNLPLGNEDFFKFHGIAGKTKEMPVVKTNSKWFNICDLLKKDPNQKIYPRGYPYGKRWKAETIEKEKKEVKIALNTGLWINDPDIDAITRINRDFKTIKLTGKQIALGIGEWSPINTQNTALIADLIPAYYFVLMGEKVENLTIDRYGDIWSGFFIKKVIDSMGHYVSVGKPLVNHLRNKHNLFKDLKQELGCIIYTDLIAEILENLKLSGKNPAELYEDLSNKLMESISKKDVSDDFKKYIKKLNLCQKIWLKAIQKIR